MLHISQLIWDDWNVAHIARHDVTPQEVEEVCNDFADVQESYQGRLRVIGSTQQGRILTVILALKQDTTYYPVTARPASRTERKKIEAQRRAA